MPPDIEAQILRYYHAEKWTVGTIARQLHVHHSVVRRVLAQAGLPGIGAAPRPSHIDAYLPLIRETLEKFPTLTASRLFAMVRERGYRGSPDQREVFAEEARHLLPLPDNPAPLLERVAVKVGKSPYVRFDLNDYSVPHTYVRRVLTVLADTHELRIVDGAHVLACHRRSYDRGAQIEQTEHLQALVAHKRAARQHRATDRLAQVAPASQDVLLRAAERGANLGAITTGLMRLLERYGAAELQVAIREALDRDVPHPNAVRIALERRREARGEVPPVAVDLPAAVQARDAPVQPHALETYDQLKDAADV